MDCTQCGAEFSDEEWNCPACGMNVYWASQHFDDIAQARERQGLAPQPDTPSFLRRALEQATIERAAGAERADDKTRQIARRAMRRRSESGQ